MGLVGCFAIPHPPIVVPEVGGASLAEAEATVRAMTAVREKTAALAPDTIVLLSPHSPLARSQMGVSLAAAYRGSLAYFRAPQRESGRRRGRSLGRSHHGEGRGPRHTGDADRRPGGDLRPRSRGHGAPGVSHGRAQDAGRLVVLSFSYLSLDEHVRFGRAVGEALMAAEQRIVYVASSDLSHRLIPGAPAGYDPRAALFDQAVADTFAAGDWEGLLTIDPGLVSAAGECGYRSLAVLSGLVEAYEAAGGETHNRLLSYEGPWGVGYLVGEVELSLRAGRRTDGARSAAVVRL